MTLSEEFGRTIRTYRKSKGYSQESLAERCGLHPTYIGQIERGQKCPTIDTVDKIAKGLEVPITHLFGFIEVADSFTPVSNELFELIEQQPASKQATILAIVKQILNMK